MSLSLYTISAENAFLRVLARAVLAGFPVNDKTLPLSRWTILVPNRRSARELEQVFLAESGSRALLLPRIKPIGDIDEDLIADSLPSEGVADGIAKTDHLHAILQLLLRWAKEKPESDIAQDVLASGAQAFALARSLQQLVNQFETEDADVDAIKGVYDLDLAGHRQNILDLLTVITRELPATLKEAQLIGPAARRNVMIRLEAARISNRQHRGPIIAAGSTGTNPATRDLLKAIASDPMGAVILPGVDKLLDHDGWKAITPEHPQFSLATLLQQFGATRNDVKSLGQEQAARSWLISEALRPAAVADKWIDGLKGRAPDVQKGLACVEFVEAADRAQEAEVIALRLRQHVACSTGQAALITPDRDLATRVKASLRRWNLSIDDSAGEPLVHQGRAALLFLLLVAVEDNFASTSLFAMLHHASCQFGRPRADHLSAARHLELAAFRGQPQSEGLAHLADHLLARKQSLLNDPYGHPLLKAMTEDDWSSTISLALQLHAALTPLRDAGERSLADHVDRLLTVLDALSPALDALDAADQALLDVMTSLKQGSHWHPVMSLSKARHSIIQALSAETLRPPLREGSQLAIYGLAEARLVDVELAILGGLAEGAWPEHPDSGPWLNRPMRDAIKLQQPERNIGVTAHDFAQAFCHRNVMLTWPRRIKGAPAIPSRWVLRLQTVLKTVGIEWKDVVSPRLPKLAERLDAPTRFRPSRRPQVKPPVEVRPTIFSVSRVEKLLRDSYWVYARNILNLQPLEDMGGDIDAALRGTLVHDALQHWTRSIGQVPKSERLHLLLAKGQDVFKPYLDMPEVARFWWPRFARMAEDFIARNDELTAATLNTLTEVSGSHDFDVGGTAYRVTARADRIDINRSGALRIIDYKTGSIPSLKQVTSGFAPQLTLEGAIARRQGFKGINSTKLEDVMYIGVGGGRKPVELRGLSPDHDVNAEAEKAFAGLLKLLAAFQQLTTPYIPLHNPEMSDDASDYDHLSRRLEWQLVGTVS